MWTRWDSNPRPLQCHCSALPTELRAHYGNIIILKEMWHFQEETKKEVFFVVVFVEKLFYLFDNIGKGGSLYGE